ncbi:hypothetical protein JCM9957A_56090 [Kineosporia succinea]|uniref:Transcriptional regulator WhiB n=1 Tax=Kineosporia succinea TaxID=84632 RepID=A0ABT9P6L8_9ACTN|nr:hypothetical protein [Kineosporia succinea]
MSGPAWQHDGACIDEDPELFFPIGSTGPAIQQIEEAKAVCHLRCPVRLTCLNWALETRQEHGVWGGLSEDERRSLKRRETRAGRKPKVKATPTAPPRTSVSADAARDALVAARSTGLTWPQIGGRAGMDTSAVRLIAIGGRPTILAETERRILSVWAPKAGR